MKKKALTKKTALTRIGILASMLVLVIGLMSVVFSQSSEERRSSTRQSMAAREKRMPDMSQINRPPEELTTVYVAKQKTIIDQETGLLRKPTPEEIRQTVAYLKSATNRSSEGLKAITRPDGTKRVRLEGRFAPVVIARANEDGTMETRCVTTFDEAIEFLRLRPETPAEGAARKAGKNSDQ